MTQSFYDSLSKVATTGGQQKIFDMLNDPFLDTSGAHSIPGPTKADYASAHRDIVSNMNRYFSNESAAKHTVTPQPTPAPTVAQRAKTVVSEAVRKKSIPKGAYIGGGTALAATAYGAYKYHQAHNKVAHRLDLSNYEPEDPALAKRRAAMDSALKDVTITNGVAYQGGKEVDVNKIRKQVWDEYTPKPTLAPKAKLEPGARLANNLNNLAAGFAKHSPVNNMEEEANRLFTKFDPKKVKAQKDGMDQLNRMYQEQTGSKEKLGDRFKNIDTSGFDARRQEASDHIKRVMDDARANAAAKHYSRVEAESARPKGYGKKALIGAGIAAGAGAAYGAYRHFNDKTAGLPMDPNTTLVNGHKFDTDDTRFKQKDITPRVLEQEAPKEKVRASWGSVKNGIKGNKKLFGAAAAVGGAGCLGAYMVHKNKKGGANET